MMRNNCSGSLIRHRKRSATKTRSFTKARRKNKKMRHVLVAKIGRTPEQFHEITKNHDAQRHRGCGIRVQMQTRTRGSDRGSDLVPETTTPALVNHVPTIPDFRGHVKTGGRQPGCLQRPRVTSFRGSEAAGESRPKGASPDSFSPQGIAAFFAAPRQRTPRPGALSCVLILKRFFPKRQTSAILVEGNR